MSPSDFLDSCPADVSAYRAREEERAKWSAALDEAQHAAALARDERDAALLKLDAAIRQRSDEATTAQRDRLYRALGRLLRTHPRLQSDHSTHEQQAALRVAVCALEECGP